MEWYPAARAVALQAVEDSVVARLPAVVVERAAIVVRVAAASAVAALLVALEVVSVLVLADLDRGLPSSDRAETQERPSSRNTSRRKWPSSSQAIEVEVSNVHDSHHKGLVRFLLSAFVFVKPRPSV